MFIGHYGPSFACKAWKPVVPLWVLFVAVQLVDIVWAVLVLLGIEKVRIVPGITATNPLSYDGCCSIYTEPRPDLLRTLTDPWRWAR